MKTFMTMGGMVLAAALAQGAIAMEDAETRCQRYAQEEGVPADEMADYMKECIASLSQEGGVDAPEGMEAPAEGQGSPE